MSIALAFTVVAVIILYAALHFVDLYFFMEMVRDRSLSGCFFLAVLFLILVVIDMAIASAILGY